MKTTEDKINYMKAGGYYLFGNFFNKGISFLTVPIFTRLLSTGDYGTVSTYNSWVGILTMVLSMALYMAIRQAYVDFPEEINGYLSSIILFTTMISSIIFCICICVGLISNVNVLMALLCMIQSYSAAIIEDYSQYLIMTYRYRLRTAFMILPNFIGAIASIFVILFAMKDKLYLGRIIPMAASVFLFGLIALFMTLRKSRTIRKNHLKYSLAISVPLIAHGAALSILSQSDRIMITYLVDAESTGIYSVIYNLSMIATAISTALDGVWTPWFLARIKNHNKDDFQDINDVIKVYTLFISTVMCGIILVAPDILKLMTTESYWGGIDIIPPIVLANLAIFIYSFYVSVEHYHKKTIGIAINTFIAAGSNILLNFICIPIWGYKAAAYTTLVSYGISLLIHYIKAKKLEPEIANLRVYIAEILMVALVCMFYYRTLDMCVIRWVVAILLGFLVMLYIWINYKTVIYTLKGEARKKEYY